MRKLLLVLLILIGCTNRLDYDAIGLHEPVIAGGQREIDQGYVVEIDQPGIWLAGHRTTHGAVFRNLPNAKIGDTVCTYNKCFTVVRIIHQSGNSAPGYIGSLVLQTSLPGGVLLVVAE